MDQPKLTIGRWLRLNNMSQAECARRAGINIAVMHNVFRGDPVSPKVCKALRTVVGEDVDIPLGKPQGRPRNVAKAKLLVSARNSGASYWEIARNFGFGNEKRAAEMVCYYRKKIAEWNVSA